MKSYKSMTCMLAALVAGLMLVSQSAFAQAGAGGGGGGRGGGRGLGPDATEEQTAAYRAMNQETTDLAAKVTAARTELNNAIFAAKVDEAAIKSKAAVLAKAEEELALGRAKAFDKVRAKFTPAQIETMKAAGQGGRGGGQRRGGAGQ